MSNDQKQGKCHICGKVGKLSYEHIPPASAYNKASRKVYNAVDIVQGGGLPWEIEGVRNKILQRGIGAYTLCPKCNSFIGSKYARDFINGCKQTMESGQVEIMKDTQRARVKLYKINPLSLAKQILAMFASVNGPEFFETNPELRNLILDENSYGLDPSKYALFVYLYRGGMGRNSGISVIMTTDGMMTISSELTTVPFGFVLVLKPNRDRLENCGTEITGLFNDYEPEVIDDFMFEMPMYEQNGPMPLDFRTKEDIMKQMSSE